MGRDDCARGTAMKLLRRCDLHDKGPDLLLENSLHSVTPTVIAQIPNGYQDQNIT